MHWKDESQRRARALLRVYGTLEQTSESGPRPAVTRQGEFFRGRRALDTLREERALQRRLAEVWED